MASYYKVYNQATSSSGGPVAHGVAYPSQVDFFFSRWIIVDEKSWLEGGVFLGKYFQAWICCNVDVDGLFVDIGGLV